jgi:hypothetical protein
MRVYLPQEMPKLLKAGQAAAALSYDAIPGSSKLLLLPPVDNPRNVIDYPMFCARAEVRGLVCNCLFTCRQCCTCYAKCACRTGCNVYACSQYYMASLTVQAVESAECKQAQAQHGYSAGSVRQPLPD